MHLNTTSYGWLYTMSSCSDTPITYFGWVETPAPRLLYSNQCSQLLLQQSLPLYLLFGQSLQSHRRVLSARRFLMDPVWVAISLDGSTKITTIQWRSTVPGPIWLSILLHSLWQEARPSFHSIICNTLWSVVSPIVHLLRYCDYNGFWVINKTIYFERTYTIGF